MQFYEAHVIALNLLTGATNSSLGPSHCQRDKSWANTHTLAELKDEHVVSRPCHWRAHRGRIQRALAMSAAIAPTTWAEVFNGISPIQWANYGVIAALVLCIIGAGWGILITGASLVGAAVKSPRIRSRNLVSVIFCEATAIYGVIIAIMIANKVCGPRPKEDVRCAGPLNARLCTRTCCRLAAHCPSDYDTYRRYIRRRIQAWVQLRSNEPCRVCAAVCWPWSRHHKLSVRPCCRCSRLSMCAR